MLPTFLLLLPVVYTRQVVSFHRERVESMRELLSQVECPSYSCADSPLSDGLCVEYIEEFNQYALQECNSTETCVTGINPQTNVTCIPALPVTPPRYPGSPCQTDADCPSKNNCTNKVCHGGAAGANCTVESSCDIGLTCYRNVGEAYCTKQLDFGEPCSGYIDDTMCQNNAVCGLHTCIPWFSLANGQFTTSAYAAYACSSGFYETIPGRTDIVICAEAPKSPLGQMPILCSPGSQCYSLDGKYSQPCQCGFNGEGWAYCPLFPGDDPYRNYLSLLQQYSLNLTQCAFIAIGEIQCGSSTQVWEALNEAHVEVSFWGLSEGNDKCVKAIFTGPYWNETTPDLPSPITE